MSPSRQNPEGFLLVFAVNTTGKIPERFAELSENWDLLGYSRKYPTPPPPMDDIGNPEINAW